MRNLSRLLLVSTVVLSLVLPQARAVERLKIQVVCDIAESRYQDILPAPDRTSIERECAARLARLLSRKFRFVDFTAGTQEPTQLHIRIGKPANPASPDAIRPVEFEIFVQGSGVSPNGNVLTWIFRGDQERLDSPSAETFADSIFQRFSNELERKGAQLVRQQLSRVAIADQAYPLPGYNVWLLPFARNDLRIADESELQIDVELQHPALTQRRKFYAILDGDYGEHNSVPVIFHFKPAARHRPVSSAGPAGSMADLGNAIEVRVKRVSVTVYRPSVAPATVSPSELVQQ